MLSETWQSKAGMVKLLGYTNPIEKVTQKISKFGHNPGGLMVFVKLKLGSCVTEIKSRCNSVIWVKVNNHDTDSRIILLCFVYFHPESSKFANPQDFSVLEEEFIEFKNLYPNSAVFMVGDWNARTGQLDDVFDDDITNACDVFTQNSDDNGFLHRENKDTTVNSYGNMLCSLCKSNDMCIVNGRYGDDRAGEFTFINRNGRSTIDYLVTEKDNLPMIKSFHVASRVESCHMPLCFEIILHEHFDSVNNDDIDTFHVSKYKWNNEKIGSFTNRLHDERCNDLKNAIGGSHTVSDMLDIMYNILYYCGDNMQVKTKNRQAKNSYNWYNNECQFAKHTCRQHLNRYRKAIEL